MLHGLDISDRHTILDGREFGPAGAYEQLYGSARFRLDPTHARNLAVVDLELAPRDGDGLVGCRADIWLLKPVDAATGNGALFYHVVNRGRKGMLSSFQHAVGSNTPGTAEQFGDGLLMEQGFAMAAVGWQADVPPHGDDERDLMTLDVPQLHGVTGPVACEIVVDEPTQLHSLGSRYHLPYEWSDQHIEAAVLSVRDEPYGQSTVLPRNSWSFDRLADGRAAVRLGEGFVPGRIYNLVYTGRDPGVFGLGFAVTRDVVAFLRHEQSTPEGQANPLAGCIDRAHAFGSSQSGRFLRHMMYEGFNTDEAGRQVFDGLFVSVGGGGMGSFNHRFAQPSRHSSAHVDVFYPTEVFPFHDLPQTDPETDTTAGLLDTCIADDVVPRTFYTNTSTEYWNRSSSLIHTDIEGQHDVPPHPLSRIYHFSGTQHGPGALPDPGETLPANPVFSHLCFRPLILALDAWVRDDVAPPDSAYSTVADGTLVSLESVAWPELNELPLPTQPRRSRRLNWGENWAQGRIDCEPPTAGAFYPVLFPQVDADGNEIGGVRLPEVSVPLGSFTGWRLRTEAMGATWALAGLSGVWLPFAPTQAAAEAAGDPRPALSTRYKDRADYVDRCVAAAHELVDRRLLVQQDVPRVAERAGIMYDYAISR